MRKSSCLLIAALALSGCDLLDLARNPSITFKLPAQSYSFSTMDARWKAPPPTFSQRIDCSMPPDCCTLPGAPAGTPASFDCAQFSLTCDAGQCGISFPLETARAVDLSKEVGGQAGAVVSSITLKSLDYTVNNQLGVGLPPVNVYVAPMGVTSASSPQAQLVGTFPMTAAGVDTGGTIVLSPQAQQAFSTHARDLQTPFNLIAGTTMVVRSGSPPPMGEVSFKVTGTITVKF
jgi:hypothetical protein